MCPSRKGKRGREEAPCQVCSKPGHQAPDCPEEVGEEDDQEEEDQDGEILAECSECEAAEEDSCAENSDGEECPNAQQRGEAIGRHLREQRRKSGKVAKVAEPTPKEKKKKTSKPARVVAITKVEDIVTMNASALAGIAADQVVGVPDVWVKWIKAQPSATRKDAWRDLNKEANEFYTTSAAPDSRVSKTEVANAKRAMDVLQKMLDPGQGYTQGAESERVKTAVAFLAAEAQALATAREEGWSVARKAQQISTASQLQKKSVTSAVAKAKKILKTSTGGGGRATGGGRGFVSRGRGGRGNGRGRN